MPKRRAGGHGAGPALERQAHVALHQAGGYCPESQERPHIIPAKPGMGQRAFAGQRKGGEQPSSRGRPCAEAPSWESPALPGMRAH